MSRLITPGSTIANDFQVDLENSVEARKRGERCAFRGDRAAGSPVPEPRGTIGTPARCAAFTTLRHLLNIARHHDDFGHGVQERSRPAIGR